MRLINTYTSDFAVRLMQPAQKPRAWVVDDTRVVIGRTGTAGRVLVSSFSPIAVRAWMRRMPSVPAALLFERDAPLTAHGRQWPHHG